MPLPGHALLQLLRCADSSPRRPEVDEHGLCAAQHLGLEGVVLRESSMQTSASTQQGLTVAARCRSMPKLTLTSMTALQTGALRTVTWGRATPRKAGREATDFIDSAIANECIYERSESCTTACVSASIPRTSVENGEGCFGVFGSCKHAGTPLWFSMCGLVSRLSHAQPCKLQVSCVLAWRKLSLQPVRWAAPSKHQGLPRFTVHFKVRSPNAGVTSQHSVPCPATDLPRITPISCDFEGHAAS